MENSVNFLLSPIGNVPGIGKKTEEFFNKIGVYSKFDLINHLPVRINTKLFFPNLSEITGRHYAVLKVKVLEIDKSSYKIRGKHKYIKIVCNYGGEYVDLLYFNFPAFYLSKKITPNAEIIVSGILERTGRHSKIIHPTIHDNPDKISKVDLVYPLTFGINNALIRKSVNFILINTSPVLEWIPKNILEKKKWRGWYESVCKIHNPESQKDIDLESPYFQRLAFDELFASQLAIKIVRKNRSELSRGKEVKFHGVLALNVIKEAGFTLTNGQRAAIRDIENDQRSYTRMMRLIQGDVGSGKTLVALCAMLNARESRMQSALMAPTEILAKQHYENISELVRNRDVIVEVLTSKTSKAKRRDILIKLKERKIHILIGTHALFQKDVEFNNLGLVVIDEQHRFGVQQRMELMNKGDSCDVLVMSATPIPRTLAMSVYGDLDISTITDKPAGRQPIDTLTISEDREYEIIDFIKKKINSKEQVYWVCPLISSEDNEAEEVESFPAAERRFKTLQKFFPEDVELLHGKMSVEEKDVAMKQFVSGRKKILVSTTVIEVGVNVPNATLLVVEKSEKFGLSQLHQLRGRVGRGEKKSHCILMFSKTIGVNSKERLKTLKKSNDGFYIAEQDFKIRGGGDILGSKQSGLPNYKVANLQYHSDLLFEASNAAKEILSRGDEKSENLRELLKLYRYDEVCKYIRS